MSPTENFERTERTTLRRLPKRGKYEREILYQILDEEADMLLPVWAGELPLHIVTGAPVPDPQLMAGIELPEYIRNYTRSRDRANINLSVR